MAAPELVEKRECAEVKSSMEEHGVSPPKESEEKLKDDKSEQGEEKRSEPPAAPASEEEEKPKVEDSSTIKEEKPNDKDLLDATVPLATSGEKVEDNNTHAAPTVDASPKDNPELGKGEISKVAEHGAENGESKSEEHIEVKSSENPTEEAGNDANEEQPKKDDEPESSLEAVGVKKEVIREALPNQEPKGAVGTVAETPEGGHAKEVISATLPVEEEKPSLPPSITEEEPDKDSAEAEPKELKSAPAEAAEVEAKDVKSTPAEAPESNSDYQVASINKEAEVEARDVKSASVEASESNSDQLTTIDKEAEVEEKDVKSDLAEVAESNATETKEKEPTDTVEEPVIEKSEEKTKEIKGEETEDLTEVPEKEVQTETQKADEIIKPAATEEVAEVTSLAEKTVEGDNTSRDITMVNDNGIRNDEIVAPIESNKAAEVPAALSGASLGELLKPQAEEKELENVEKAADYEVEKEKETDEAAKPDVATVETTKDADANKETSKEDSVHEVPTKTKQPNNILTKMKQSLVKAKKAIIGKSPNSKTPSSEIKADSKAA